MTESCGATTGDITRGQQATWSAVSRSLYRDGDVLLRKMLQNVYSPYSSIPTWLSPSPWPFRPFRFPVTRHAQYQITLRSPTTLDVSHVNIGTWGVLEGDSRGETEDDGAESDGGFTEGGTGRRGGCGGGRRA